MDRNDLKSIFDGDFNENELDLVEKAYRMAEQALDGMKRGNDAPFITHPVGVAKIVCNEIGMNADCAVAVFLHEATRFHPEILEREDFLSFPQDIRNIAVSLNRIASIRPKDTRLEADTYRRLIISYSHDPRVTLIKLADRLEVKVEDGELCARLRGDDRDGDKMKEAEAVVYVTGPAVGRMEAVSLGSIEATRPVAADRLELRAASMGKIVMPDFDGTALSLDAASMGSIETGAVRCDSDGDHGGLPAFRFRTVFSESRIKMFPRKMYRKETRNGAETDPQEEVTVSRLRSMLSGESGKELLHFSGEHSDQRHAEDRDARHECKMTRFVFPAAVGKLDHEQNMRHVAESVAELLQSDADPRRTQSGMMKRQIHIKQIRQIQRQRHAPETSTEAEAGDCESREKSSRQKTDRSGDSVNGPLLAQRESESAVRPGGQHEGYREFSELRLRKPVEKQKQHRADGAFPRKKGPERFRESGFRFAFRGKRVLCGGGGEKMVEKQQKHCGGGGGHRPEPGGGRSSAGILEAARQHDESALSGEHGAFVEDVAETGARRLIVRGEGEHVVAVRGDVVGRGDEGREKEQSHDQRKCRMVGLKRQSRRREAESEDELGAQHPRPFGPAGIQKRRPQKFEAPRQTDDAGPEGHGTV